MTPPTKAKIRAAEITLREARKRKCARCFWEWTSKGNEDPASCPRCKSYQWKEKRK